MGLLAESRHKFIADKLRNTGRIRVAELANELDVTEVTIRRDLAYLHRSGILKKTYGGAILAGPDDINISIRYRRTRNISGKRMIGKLAAEKIKDGDIIYLEAGSTCNEIIPYLIEKKQLTIIVNSLYLMARLHEQPQHKVIITGGQYRPERMDMVGPTAEATIANLGGFKAFTGADDISIDSGISGSDVVTVSFTKMVLKRASQVYFVGDRSKFDNPALYKIADIDELDYIITNDDPGFDWQQTCKNKNIVLIYPK
jgi:DeoR/GlpR family transcriptional regulator of sugar metabolism